MAKSNNLILIEECFTKILNNKGVDKGLESNELYKIKTFLKKEFPSLDITDLYVDENLTLDYFYGMHVLPSVNELKKRADYVFKFSIANNKRIENVKEIMIEMDSKLVYNSGFTPAEMTAVLMHEIGHKTMTNELTMVAAGMAVNAIMKSIGLATAIVLPLPTSLGVFAISSIFTSATGQILSLEKEKIPDSFAVKQGYAVELTQVLGKLESMQKNKLIKFRYSKDTSIIENTSLVIWTIDSMINFRLRKESILKQLIIQSKAKNLSEMERKLILAEIENIKKYKPSLVEVPNVPTKQLKESVLMFFNENALNTNIVSELYTISESLKTFIEMQLKGRSMLEVEELRIELTRITTNDDKLYCVTRIINNISIAEKKLKSLTDENKSDKVKLELFIKEMQKLLEQARLIKLKDDASSITIVYDKDDYEFR